MSDTEAIEDVKKGSGWLVILGILTVVLGLIAMGSPFLMSLAATYWVGAALLVGGLFQFIHGFKAVGWAGKIFMIVVGLLTALAGIMILARPLMGMALLTLLLAIFFIADGVCTIFAAFRCKPERGWGWLLFSGIMTVLLGVLIYAKWPLSGAMAIGILVGIRLLFAGWGMIFFGGTVRSVAKAAGEARKEADVASGSENKEESTKLDSSVGDRPGGATPPETPKK